MSSIVYSGKNLPSKHDRNFQSLLQNIGKRKIKTFPYTRRITRSHPTSFVFLIDQSGSMDEKVTIEGQTTSKAEKLAEILNQSLNELIDRCKKGNELRDYFHICLIGYGGDSDNTSKILWGGNLQGKPFLTPNEMVQNCISREEMDFHKPRPDGTSRIVKKTIYKWVEPVASRQTPMRAAFELAHDLLVQWIAEHPESYPPTVINITDGQATDASDEQLIRTTQAIRQLYTDDGNVIVFNIHLSTECEERLYFPCTKQELPNDRWAHLMFDMSTGLPSLYNPGIAQFTKKELKGEYTALVINGDMSKLSALLNIGTNTQTLEVS